MTGKKKSGGLTERIKKAICCAKRAKVADGTQKSMTQSFTEHTWDLNKIASYHGLSNIDPQVPSRSKGLSNESAGQILHDKGPNLLPKPKEMTNLELFFRQFADLLWALLLTADALSFVSYLADTSQLINLWCAVAIFVMIVFMCCVSFYQEREARLVVKSFENLLPEQSVVLRDGREVFVEAKNLVVGDLIKVTSGTKVPADARLILASGLKVETSSITGESEPIDYQVEPVASNTNIFEAHNTIFNGSLVIEGEGIAVVIRTASDTVIGQIALLTTGQKDNKSLLEQQMLRFVKFLVVLATSVALVAFIIGGFVHKWKHVVQLLCNGFLVCAIGMVPCGFPATVTSIITVVARRLASKQVYLKKLDICEAIGSCNIIASDKTGTLTKNIMTVTDVWYCNETLAGVPEPEALSEPMYRMLEIMGICNSAKFSDQKKKGPLRVKLAPSAGTKVKTAMKAMICGESGKNLDAESQMIDANVLDLSEKSALGSPSEVAMLRYADKLVDLSNIQDRNDVVFEIPFNSRRKWHLLIVKENELSNGEAEYKLLIKGASEIVIKMCRDIITKDGIKALTDIELDQFEQAYDHFGSNGRRIIGFAETRFMASSNVKFDLDAGNFPLNNLTFVGFCAIMDPPKDETADAIVQCRNAGIKVFMVTGDHQITATAIGRQIGLVDGPPGKEWEVICGEEVSRLSSADWDRLIKMKALIFARTTPEQKLAIVEECQKRKQIIAMTGDGVNDAPALKRANIGIAMGSGSEVAKDSADVILMNDNFASIVDAVKEGRLMFDNLKKLLGYTQIHSYPEVMPVIVNFCLGMPIGITSLQILSIDLVTEIPPGVAMAKEPAENDIMLKPPRPRSKKLVSNSLLAYSYTYAGILQTLGCFLSYCCVFWSHNINISDLWMSAIDAWQPDGTTFISNGREFSVEEQLYINRQACSAWHVGIVFGQFWHLFAARTRRQSIFTHGVFRNANSNIALVLEVILLSIFVYCPGINEFLGGAPIPWTCWLVVAGMGWFLILIAEIRKFFIRRYPTNPIVRLFKW